MKYSICFLCHMLKLQAGVSLFNFWLENEKCVCIFLELSHYVGKETGKWAVVVVFFRLSYA